MEKTNLKTPVRNILLFIAAVIMISSLNSCALKKPFLLSSVEPAARGTVTIKSDKNKNYKIKVQVYNLAEANRLSGVNSTYVVWMITVEKTTKNIGQIRSSTSILSKRLKASLETKSSFKPTKIFLTIEDDSSIQSPLGQVVLSTNNF